MEVGQREFDARRQTIEQRRVGVLFWFKIVECDASEIRYDQPAGNLSVAPGILEATDIVHSLRVCFVEIRPGGLVLDE